MPTLITPVSPTQLRAGQCLDVGQFSAIADPISGSVFGDPQQMQVPQIASGLVSGGGALNLGRLMPQALTPSGGVGRVQSSVTRAGGGARGGVAAAAAGARGAAAAGLSKPKAAAGAFMRGAMAGGAAARAGKSATEAGSRAAQKFLKASTPAQAGGQSAAGASTGAAAGSGAATPSAASGVREKMKSVGVANGRRQG